MRVPNPHVDEDQEQEPEPADGIDEHYRRMRKYFGFTPRPLTLARCPRIVAGKRCVVGNVEGQRCLCQRVPAHLADHARMWRDAHGRSVLSWEPYGIDGDEFAAVVPELLALGLEILIEGYSPYYPGHTVLMIIRRPMRLPVSGENP